MDPFEVLRENAVEFKNADQQAQVTCTICTNVMTDPAHLGDYDGHCQIHIFCRSCLETAIHHRQDQVTTAYDECPLCRKRFTRHDTRYGQVPNITEACDKKWINGLLMGYVRCTAELNDAKCGAEHTLEEHVRHMRECNHVERHCENDGCSFTGSRTQISQHIQECQYQQVQCESCLTQIRRLNLDEHAEVCPRREVFDDVCKKK